MTAPRPDPLGAPAWRASTHPAGLDDAELLDQCRLDRGRTSGPGGQHRNRVHTQVSLTHTPTGLSAQAGEARSPETNRKVALHRLRYLLAVEHRTPVPPGEARTALWATRCNAAGRRTRGRSTPDRASRRACRRLGRDVHGSSRFHPHRGHHNAGDATVHAHVDVNDRRQRRRG